MCPQILLGALVDGFLEITVEGRENCPDIVLPVACRLVNDRLSGPHPVCHGSCSQAVAEAQRYAGHKVKQRGCGVCRCRSAEEIDHHAAFARMLVNQQGKQLSFLQIRHQLTNV